MTCQIDAGFDVDSTEFEYQAVRKARKEHRCCECRETIRPRDRYEVSTGKWEGEVASFKTCLLCAEIRNSLFCSFVFTQMWQDLSDHNVFTLSLKGLSVEAIEKIEEFWDGNKNPAA